MSYSALRSSIIADGIGLSTQQSILRYASSRRSRRADSGIEKGEVNRQSVTEGGVGVAYLVCWRLAVRLLARRSDHRHAPATNCSRIASPSGEIDSTETTSGPCERDRPRCLDLVWISERPNRSRHGTNWTATYVFEQAKVNSMNLYHIFIFIC
jgi:hypothetical protein